MSGNQIKRRMFLGRLLAACVAGVAAIVGVKLPRPGWYRRGLPSIRGTMRCTSGVRSKPYIDSDDGIDYDALKAEAIARASIVDY